MINTVTLIGNLGDKPDLRQTDTGNCLSSFSIAINHHYYNGEGERKENTSWIQCVAWKRNAEIVTEYCQKGDKIAISGKLQQNTWENKEGKKLSEIVVVIESVELLNKKESESENFNPNPNSIPF